MMTHHVECQSHRKVERVKCCLILDNCIVSVQNAMICGMGSQLFRDGKSLRSSNNILYSLPF